MKTNKQQSKKETQQLKKQRQNKECRKLLYYALLREELENG